MAGLIPSPEDKRDHNASKHIHIFGASGITTLGMPELDAVTQIGDTCVPQSIRGRKIQHECRERGKIINLSAYFLDNTRTPDQYQGTNGSIPREMLQNCRKIGICEEHLFPPVPFKPPGTKPSSMAMDNAVYQQVENFFLLTNKQEIISSIISNCGAITGIPFTKGFQCCKADPVDPEKLPIIPMPTVEELAKIESGDMLWHMIQIEDIMPVGWKVLNTDGPGWGRRGYAVLPFDFPRLESDTWGIKDKNTPPPTIVTKDIVLWIDKKDYEVAGKQYTMDVAPIINAANKTMVPLRFVAQACGYAVGWYPERNTARISNGIDVIEIQIGQNYYTLNGEVRILSWGEFPFIQDGRTMVPIRLIIENFGRKIDWFGDMRKIVIYSSY